MKHNPLHTRSVIAAVAVTGSIVGSVVPAATTRSQASAATSYPSWRAFTSEQESPTHTYTEAQAVAVAQRFNVLTATKDAFRRYVAAMRAANPKLKLYAYTNASFVHGPQKDTFPLSWYVLDTAGNKVQNNWGLWLMNPTNGEWVANRVQNCIDAVQYSGYDGCFLDNLGTGSIYVPDLTGTPVNPRTGAQWTSVDWLRATSAAAIQIRTQTGLPLVSNGLSNGGAYFDPISPTSALLEATDRGMAETFVRAARSPVNSYRSEALWKQDVDMLVDANKKGQQVLAYTKVWVATATQAQKDAWHRYAFATFLLGDSGLGKFTFSYGPGTNNLVDHPWWKVSLGIPVEPYTKLGHIYQRAFANGLVLVNPTDRATTVYLGTALVDLNGVSLTTVTLRPHDAQILRTP